MKNIVRVVMALVSVILVCIVKPSFALAQDAGAGGTHTASQLTALQNRVSLCLRCVGHMSQNRPSECDVFTDDRSTFVAPAPTSGETMSVSDTSWTQALNDYNQCRLSCLSPDVREANACRRAGSGVALISVYPLNPTPTPVVAQPVVQPATVQPTPVVTVQPEPARREIRIIDAPEPTVTQQPVVQPVAQMGAMMPQGVNGWCGGNDVRFTMGGWLGDQHGFLNVPYPINRNQAGGRLTTIIVNQTETWDAVQQRNVSYAPVAFSIGYADPSVPVSATRPIFFSNGGVTNIGGVMQEFRPSLITQFSDGTRCMMPVIPNTGTGRQTVQVVIPPGVTYLRIIGWPTNMGSNQTQNGCTRWVGIPNDGIVNLDPRWYVRGPGGSLGMCGVNHQ